MIGTAFFIADLFSVTLYDSLLFFPFRFTDAGENMFFAMIG
jgi:hypothetical protein